MALNSRYLIIGLLFSINVYAQEKHIKVFPFKSAIIEYKYEASASGTHIKYIDDYGYKQADYILKELNFGGVTEKQYETIILIGNKTYTINWQDSTVAVGRNTTYDYYTQNQDKTGTEVSEAILRTAYGCELSGKKTFLKKECKVWITSKSTLLTWNGVELKSEINFMTMMVEKATNIKVNKKIKNNVFDIPQGFRYISTDVYQGFPGLKLNFDTGAPKPSSSDSQIEASFSASDLGGNNSFKYYTAESEVVLSEGVNDYNKIDRKLIKSQQFELSDNTVDLTMARTLIFETQNGELGKLQLKEISESKYEIRYVVFSQDGTIKFYSDGTTEMPGDDFRIFNNENKLTISPIGKARCFLLGW